MRSLRTVFVAAFFVLGQALAAQESKPFFCADAWSRATGGRILGLPASGKDGTIYSLSEDKSLYAWDLSGRQLWKMTREERFLPWITVTEKGMIAVGFHDKTVSLLQSAPEGSRRWMWTFRIDGPLSAPIASDRNGNLYAATEKGSLYRLSPDGQMLWSRPLSTTPIRALAADVGARLLAVTDENLVILDFSGRVTRTREVRAQAAGLLVASTGRVVVWGRDWISAFDDENASEAWTLFWPGSRIQGVVLTELEQLGVATQTAMILVGAQGKVLKEQKFPRRVTGPPAIGTAHDLFFPSSDGFMVLTAQGVWEKTGLGPTSGLVLNTQGLLAVGSESWIVHAFATEAANAQTWSQEGRGPGHDHLSLREGDWEELVRSWDSDADYQVLKNLASRPDSESQLKLLAEMEEQEKKGTLLDQWPFANLLLAQIALSGIEWVQTHEGRVLNNWPSNRSRAYRILARTADPALRKVLIRALGKEFDSEALAGAVESLGKLGYDYDGAVSRALGELQRRKPDDQRVAAALITAGEKIWRFNRRIPDEALVRALAGVYQGNFPREIRLQAQVLFQKFLGWK